MNENFISDGVLYMMNRVMLLKMSYARLMCRRVFLLREQTFVKAASRHIRFADHLPPEMRPAGFEIAFQLTSAILCAEWRGHNVAASKNGNTGLKKQESITK